MYEDDTAGLARWDTGDACPTDATVARLAAHPRFAEAVRMLCRNMLDAGAGDKALDGIFKDAGRYVVAFIAIYLHLSGGLTLPRLKALVAASGMSSPGRARAVLLYMRYLGFIVRGPRAAGEALTFLPTPRCLTAWSSHLAAALKAAAVIDPAAEQVLRAFNHPDTFASFARRHSECLLAAAGNTQRRDGAFIRTLHRHAASQVLWTLILAERDGQFPPRLTVPVPIAGLSQRFGVSRTHLRRLFRDAERQGVLTQHADGTVTFADGNREEVVYGYASQLAMLLVAANRTLGDMPHLAG